MELRVSELQTLDGVPGADGPMLRLLVDHADLECAGRLVITAQATARELRDSGRA